MSDVTVTKEVLTPVTAVTGLVSMGAYARHRGTSKTAVHRAVESGRLDKSITRSASGRFLGINSVELADQEWVASTDLTKAPTAVIERAEAQQTPTPSMDETPSPELGAITGTEDPDRLSPLMRQKYWQAKTAELDYKRQIGELVDAKEVEARMIDEYSECRTKLLGIARKAKAALPHLSPVDVVTIDNLVREALEVLAGPTPKNDQQTP